MKTLTLTIAAFATATAFADWNLSLTSGWRVIGGANYNSGLKTDLKVSGARALPHMPSVPSSGGRSRSQAETAAKRVLNGQAVSFDNGAFIDPDYSGKDAMPDYTWNWHALAGSYQNGSMSFGTDYTEVSSSDVGNLVNSSHDDRDIPGFTVEIQRNLGQWGAFGLDMGLGFNYFRRNDAFKSSGEVYRRTDTVERGTYVAGVGMEQDMADWAMNPDGSYGAGTFEGPGALMSIGSGAFSFSDKMRNVSRTAHSMYLDSSADYEEIELTIAAKPYYDITEWFRVVGTLGVAVSRGELDLDMMAASDGRRIYSDSERFSQWDCYGIGGLGGMFHSWHMCLGFDFLARFFDRDIDVNGRSVAGSVERCPWMFRVYAGFEF